MLAIKQIYKKWSDIVDMTYQKQTEMRNSKITFSNQTRVKDEEFQIKVEEF